MGLISTLLAEVAPVLILEVTFEAGSKEEAFQVLCKLILFLRKSLLQFVDSGTLKFFFWALAATELACSGTSTKVKGTTIHRCTQVGVQAEQPCLVLLR